MKIFLSIMALLCLCHYSFAQKGRTDLTFIVKDQSTGFAIPNATVTVHLPNGKAIALRAAQNGKLSYTAIDGRYNFTIDAPNYKSLETFFATGNESAIEANINLDPVTTATDQSTQSAQSIIQLT